MNRHNSSASCWGLFVNFSEPDVCSKGNRNQRHPPSGRVVTEERGSGEGAVECVLHCQIPTFVPSPSLGLYQRGRGVGVPLSFAECHFWKGRRNRRGRGLKRSPVERSEIFTLPSHSFLASDPPKGRVMFLNGAVDRGANR